MRQDHHMKSVRLQQLYHTQIRPQLKTELKLANLMAAPQLVKLVLNIGISPDQHQDQALASAAKQLALITGQQPVTTLAKKSISEFNIRAKDPIGLKVTLRGKRMYQFLDKLINLVLPQLKDFQGIAPTSFDGAGNYTLGLKEQIVFPEITYDTIDQIRGLEITLVTTARTNQEAKKLLQLLGMPFRKES